VLCSIRDITAEVGAAVLRAAVAEELAEGHGDVGPRELKNMSKV
jgi:malate dehydrogenase (decarboxylating)